MSSVTLVFIVFCRSISICESLAVVVVVVVEVVVVVVARFVALVVDVVFLQNIRGKKKSS